MHKPDNPNAKWIFSREEVAKELIPMLRTLLMHTQSAMESCTTNGEPFGPLAKRTKFRFRFEYKRDERLWRQINRWLKTLTPDGECRRCGCTDADCHLCIDKTGEPCSWIEPKLCSACDAGEMR